MRTESNTAIAEQNRGLLDLQRGDRVRDEDGEVATFVSYGDNEPIYVNLAYSGLRKPVRLPNSNLRKLAR